MQHINLTELHEQHVQGFIEDDEFINQAIQKYGVKSEMSVFWLLENAKRDRNTRIEREGPNVIEVEFRIIEKEPNHGDNSRQLPSGAP